MRIADNMELAQKRAKEEAKIKAEKERQEKEAERQKKEAIAKWEREHPKEVAAKKVNPYKTIDLSELYKDIAEIQLFDDLTGKPIPYRHHSEFFEN